MLEPDEFEPGLERGGWQHEASSRVEQQHREEVLFERLAPRDRAWAIAEWSWRQLGPDHVTHLSTDKKSHRTCSGWCCYAASVSNYLCLSIRAVVAVPSTLLATTSLLAPGRGRWGDGGLRWKVQQHVCAERQEGG